MIRRSIILDAPHRVVIAPAENTWRVPSSARKKLRRLRGRFFEGVRQLPQWMRSNMSLLTLTAGQNERTPDQAYDQMREAWNALMTWWRQQYPHMKFFRTVELHESGFPHFHVLLIGAPFIAQKEISDQWARLLGQLVAIVDIRKVRNSEHAVRYVTKYLLKQSENFDLLEHQMKSQKRRSRNRAVSEASWWRRRVRPWSSSRGLLAPSPERPEPWWSSIVLVARMNPWQVAELAFQKHLDVLRWNDSDGFYELGIGGSHE